MLSFVFPGQGSQQPNMGEAFTREPSWALVAEASDIVGRDVAHLLLDATADELVQTRNAQLGTFVKSMVVHDALKRRGFEPGAMAGHSLGELSALCAAGALSFPDATRLVAERGEAMQVVCTERPGTMAAVLGLDDATVAEVCEATDGDVWLANLNAPGQVVVAGEPDAVARAGVAAKEAGAKRFIGLDVAGAFHTPYMIHAEERLAAAMADVTFRDPVVPTVANVDAQVHASAADWPQLLSHQLTTPVRWADSVRTLIDMGVTTFVEVGPGNVLTGTIKWIDRSKGRHSVMTPEQLETVARSVEHV